MSARPRHIVLPTTFRCTYFVLEALRSPSAPSALGTGTLESRCRLFAVAATARAALENVIVRGANSLLRTIDSGHGYARRSALLMVPIQNFAEAERVTVQTRSI